MGAHKPDIVKIIVKDGITGIGDYLSSREEVDPECIRVTRMGMGGIRANWLAGLDDHVKVTVSVACLTRMQGFIRTGNINGMSSLTGYPGMVAKFDTEQMVSLIAPRNYVQRDLAILFPLRKRPVQNLRQG